MWKARAVAVACIASSLAMSACARKAVSYHQDIQPILQQHCAQCHSKGGVGYAASGFSVESYAAVMKGTKFGPMVEPGHSTQSNLVWLLQHGAHPAIDMPKICQQLAAESKKCSVASSGAEQLPKRQVRLIAQWVDQGAKDN